MLNHGWGFYLEIIIGPRRNVIIKLHHHVPRPISNTD